MFLGLCMSLFVLMTLPITWRAHVFEHNSCLIIISRRPESELICCVDESVGCVLLTTAYLTISERATFDRADSAQGYSHTPINKRLITCGNSISRSAN